MTSGVICTNTDSSVMKTVRHRGRTTDGTSRKSNVNTIISCIKAKTSTMKTGGQRRTKKACGKLLSTTFKCREKPAVTQQSVVDEDSEVFVKTTSKERPNQQNLDELSQESSLSNAQALCQQSEAMGTDLLKITTEVPTIEPRLTRQPFAKLKLQLFPVNEGIRKGLEKDDHNPHLELTLSARKKISSVLKHLISKWGNSSVASEGELMLFPENIQQENLANYRRWMLDDSDTSAADVYAAIGSPAIFRLRYGWFSDLDPVTSKEPLVSHSFEHPLQPKEIQGGCTNMKSTEREGQSYHLNSQECKKVPTSNSSNVIVGGSIPSDRTVKTVDNLKIGSDTTFLSGVSADSLSNISFGELLSRCDPMPIQSSSSQQIPFSCDSFDAAIAAHIYGSRALDPSTQVSSSSIWDAEETCHAFQFQKIKPLSEEVTASTENATSETCNQNVTSSSSRFLELVEANARSGLTQEHAFQEPAADSLPHMPCLDNGGSNMGISNIYWPDSLGPLDLGISSSRQIISGDSISLSGLIATSLDAFQNCSFFGGDKKVQST